MEFTRSEKPLKANMAWNSIGSLTYFGCQWLITILVVRLSESYEQAGILSLAMSVANIFTPFALYRMRAYQVSDVKNDFSTSEYMGLRIITVSSALAVCMVYACFTCSPSSLLAIFLYLCFKSTELFIDVMQGLLQKHMRLDYAGKSMIVRGGLSVASFAGTLFFTDSLELAIASMIAVSMVVALLIDIPAARCFDSLKPCFSISNFRYVLLQCLPVVIASVATGAAMSVSKQLLGSLQGENVLGIYSSVAAPVAIVQLGASYIYSPILGRFANFHLKHDKRAFFDLLARISIAIAVIAIGCAAVFQWFGPAVVTLLYGAETASYCYLLLPMIVCSVLTAYQLFLSDLLLSIREFTGNCLGGMASLLVSLLLSAMLIDRYGMNGVSVTGIAAYSISSLISLVFLIRKIRRDADLNGCHPQR